MTNELIIKINELSKRYRIGHRIKHDHLREVIVSAFLSVVNVFKNRTKKSIDAKYETIWALKDINLNINKGEVLGIIGRNGAGKSTLLKILSRITEPTTGEIFLNGRVASLLEVGTGFHPDLTGRENIYLNAAILGMTRDEINRKFYEIVEFSEIEKFLDTPIKRYSSGMYVRLAFAVAAHLEPEILLVDEVLAVGDIAFQKKCLGKMHEVSESGRTILFVSHNMGAVEHLCSRCIVLSQGKVTFDGNPSEAVLFYQKTITQISSTRDLLSENVDRRGDGRAKFQSVSIFNSQNQKMNTIKMGEHISIKLKLRVFEKIKEPRIAIYIKNQTGQTIYRLYTLESETDVPSLDDDSEISCVLPELNLPGGKYFLNIWINEYGRTVDFIESVCYFDVIATDIFGTGNIPDSKYGGIVFTKQYWNFNTR